MISHLPPLHPADWQRCPAEAAGLDPGPIAAAARYAGEHETPWGRDLAQVVARDFGEEPPWNEPLGPVRPRGGPNGLILRQG
ncbi:MAG TPA: serine hydrolase, partial [Stellaceae bacterium]|nr:serine hydrolase [Stellaceae bacterium]